MNSPNVNSPLEYSPNRGGPWTCGGLVVAVDGVIVFAFVWRKKTFCASHPVWFLCAHLFLESWKHPDSSQLEKLSSLHSTHPRFRGFTIQRNSPCWPLEILIYWKSLKCSRAKTTECLNSWWQARFSTASSRRWVDKIYPARELLES